MSLTFNTLSLTDYDNLLFQMLKDFEGVQPSVYVDSNHHATIGIGFEMAAHPRAILEGMGYANNPKFLLLVSALTTAGNALYFAPTAAQANAAAQAAINQAVNGVLGTDYGNGGGNFGYGNNTGGSGQSADAQMEATFNLIKGTYENELDGWLLDTQKPTNAQLGEALTQLPYSTERAALLSLTYNNLIGFNGNGTVKSPTLRNAILTGDRAEAWYQIRYYSNGNALRGIARRRYEESQIFGLFNNPSNPTLAGTVQAYQMLTAHRAQIEAYDKLYGNQIPTNYGLAGQTYGNVTIPPVQTLIQAFQPAETVLMDAVDAKYGSLLPGFMPSNSMGIYLNPGRLNSLEPVSSSYSYDLNAASSSGNDLLIASTGSTNGLTLSPDTGNDTLNAGSGSDVLIAGAGQDLLQAGSGMDTLIGGLGSDTLIAGTGQDTFDYVAPSSSTPTTETIQIGPESNVAISSKDTVNAGGTPLVGGQAVAGKTFTWADSGSGTQYVFTPGAEGSMTGTLVITGTPLGVPGDQIVIQNFDLAKAQGAQGELGIRLGRQVALSSGANHSADPFLSGDTAPANTTVSVSQGAVAQTFTVNLSSPGASAQQVTLTFTGGDLGAFALDTGAGPLIPLSNTMTVTVPAGATRLALALFATQDLASSQTVQIQASLAGGAPSPVTTTGGLTVDWPATGFTTPVPNSTISGQPQTSPQETIYQGNSGIDSITTGSGNNFVSGGSLGGVITGSAAGMDTIVALMGFSGSPRRTVEEVVRDFDPGRQDTVRRGLAWMIKMGVLTIAEGRGTQDPPPARAMKAR